MLPTLARVGQLAEVANRVDCRAAIPPLAVLAVSPLSLAVLLSGFGAALKFFLDQKVGKLADRPSLALRDLVQHLFLFRAHTDANFHVPLHAVVLFDPTRGARGRLAAAATGAKEAAAMTGAAGRRRCPHRYPAVCLHPWISA